MPHILDDADEDFPAPPLADVLAVAQRLHGSVWRQSERDPELYEVRFAGWRPSPAELCTIDGIIYQGFCFSVLGMDACRLTVHPDGCPDDLVAWLRAPFVPTPHVYAFSNALWSAGSSTPSDLWWAGGLALEDRAAIRAYVPYAATGQHEQVKLLALASRDDLLRFTLTYADSCGSS